MSETKPEVKPPTKPATGGPKGESKGKQNLFTKQYGPLSGWVWMIILAGTIYLYMSYKKKNAATTATTAATDTTAASNTSTTGSASDYSSGNYGGGGSAGGFYGGNGPPSYPSPTGTGTAIDSNGKSWLVSDQVDEQLLKTNGVSIGDIFYAGKDPYASKVAQDPGYAAPTDVPTYNGQPNPVYVGLAQQVAPAGSTIVAGQDRAGTAAAIKSVVQGGSGT